MAPHPALVDLDRRSVPDELGTRYATGMDFEKAERMPNRELGEKIVESQGEELGRMADRLLQTYEETPNWKAPSQKDVDDIWHRFERATRQYWTATYEEYKRDAQREFPGWEALGE